MKKRVIAALLTLCITLILSPAVALAAAPAVKIVGDGLTLSWEKYVIYEYGGEQLRSDQLSAKFNQMLWEKMSNSDRKTLTESYNIYYRNLKEHFGKENADNICKWNRAYTGWSEAGQIWRSRIGAREYPELTAYFTQREGNAFLSSQSAVGASPALAEWVEYQRLRQEFEAWFTIGEEATAKLTKFKSEQIATAFSATSGELVKMIMDNALLSKPSGNLPMEGTQQLWNYIDQLFGIKERIIDELNDGDTLTVDKAAQIINELDAAMKIHERTANAAHAECLKLGTELDAAYQALLTANDAYAQNAAAQKEGIETAASTVINTPVTPSPPVINPIPDPQNPGQTKPPEPDSAAAYQDVLAAYNAAKELYDNWAALATGHKQTIIDSATASLQVYQWPEGVDMNTLPGKSPAEMLRTDLSFFDFNETLTESVEDAIACGNGNIPAWEQYKADCENLLDSETAYYKESIEPALRGVLAYIGGNINVSDNYYYQYQTIKDNVNDKLQSGNALLADLGKMQVSGSIAPASGGIMIYSNGIQGAIDEEEREITCLGANKAAWQREVTVSLEQAERDASQYLELQNNYELAFDFVLEQDAEFKRLENELNALNWYDAQAYDARGFLTKNESSDPLNSVLSPLFSSDAFKQDGSINWTARTALIRTYADTLREYSVGMRAAATGIRNGLLQCEFYAAAMQQLTGRTTGGSNNYLKNLSELGTTLKSEWEIQLKYGEDTRDHFNTLSPPGELPFLKLNIMMRDLCGNGYDFLRLREIKAALDEERADIMRLSGDAFTAKITHYQNMANFTGYSPIPAYQGTPMSMVNTRSFTWDEAATFYYTHFWGSGEGIIGDMTRKKNAGFVPAESLRGLSGGDRGGIALMAADAYDLSLAVGGSYDLSEEIYILPRNATEQDVLWDSSNHDIAGVDENGVVTGIADGIATITARAFDTPSTGSEAFTQTVVFQVGDGTPEPGITEVTISPAAASIKKGGTQTFTATVAGYGVSDDTVTWSVTGGVAGTDIGLFGLLTVASNETAETLTVTATSNEDNSKTGTATVTVTEVTAAAPNTSFSFDGANAGKLMGTTTRMKYSLDGGNDWTACTAGNTDLSGMIGGITAKNDIKVKDIGDGSTTESEVQTIHITRAATPSLTPTQPSTIGGSGSIPMTAAHEYRADSGSTWTSASGTTTLPAGTYLVRVKATGTVLASDHQSITLTAYTGFAETTPTAVVDYAAEKLTGLAANGSYAVNGANFTADASGKIGIVNAWFGTAISLVKKGDGVTTNDSAVQSLSLTARPAAPACAVTQPSASSATGGISGIKASMEYSTDAGANWSDGNDQNVTGLAPGTVLIRVKATGSAPAGLSQRITITAYNVTPPPDYKADVNVGGSGGTTLPVTVDESKNTASVETSPGLLNAKGTVVTMPSIPGVSTYAVGIPIPDLSTADAPGTLTLVTGAGSVTVPANMLTGVAGVDGDIAKITIGKGDRSALPAGVKAALGDRPLIRLTLSIDGKRTDWSNPDASVRISIPYTPTAAEQESPDNIVVWYIAGTGDVVTIPNGRYDEAAGTVTFRANHFSHYAAAYHKVNFKDIASGAWYGKAVNFIAAREITKGTGGDNFSPNAKLTRSEFIVMMMRAYGIAPDENPGDNFSDAGNTWYTGYLAAAKRLGIAKGIGNNRYAPGEQISRQEMFTLLYRTLQVLGDLPSGISGKTLSDFTDAAEISSYAREPMALLVETGVVSGSDGKLLPAGTSTRAQMAQVLFNLLGK